MSWYDFFLSIFVTFILPAGLIVAAYFAFQAIYDVLNENINKPNKSKSSFVNRINNSSYKRIFSK